MPSMPQAFETCTGGIVQWPSPDSSIREGYRESAKSAEALHHRGSKPAVDNQRGCHESHSACLPRELRCERQLSLQGVFFVAVKRRVVRLALTASADICRRYLLRVVDCRCTRFCFLCSPKFASVT